MREEAVYMPTGVTYVTEEHIFSVKRILTHLALGILGAGDYHGSWGGMVQAQEGD